MQHLVQLKSGILQLSPREFVKFVVSYDKPYIVKCIYLGTFITIEEYEENDEYRWMLSESEQEEQHEAHLTFWEEKMKVIDQNIHFIRTGTDEEVSKMHDYGKEIVANMLFLYFLDEFKKIWTPFPGDSEKIILNVTKINEYIYNMIRSRDSEQENITDTELISKTLHDIPCDIISNISSWLNFKSLITFEKCSRSILMATRLPSSMHKMDEQLFKKCAEYTLSRSSGIYYIWYRFKYIKHVEFEVTDIFLWNKKYYYARETLQLNNLPFWNNLTSLKLMHTKQEFELEAAEEFKHFAELFGSCNISKLLTVYMDVDGFEGEWVYKVVTHIGRMSINCQYMVVSGDEYVDDEDEFDTPYRELILPPSLKGLSLMRLNDMVIKPKIDTVLLAVCNGLESFHDKIRDENEWGESGNNVYDNSMIHIYDKLSDSLKELCLLWHSKELINKIVEMTNKWKSLRRLNFNTSGTMIIRDIGCNEYKESIISLFRIETLDYIGITAEAKSCEIIVNLLKLALNNKQINNLTINIIVIIKHDIFQHVPDDVNNDLSEIVNVLNGNCDSAKYVLKTAKNELSDGLRKGQYYQFMIFNKLYGQTSEKKWIMACKLCQLHAT